MINDEPLVKKKNVLKKWISSSLLLSLSQVTLNKASEKLCFCCSAHLGLTQTIKLFPPAQKDKKKILHKCLCKSVLAHKCCKQKNARRMLTGKRHICNPQQQNCGCRQVATCAHTHTTMFSGSTLVNADVGCPGEMKRRGEVSAESMFRACEEHRGVFVYFGRDVSFFCACGIKKQKKKQKKWNNNKNVRLCATHKRLGTSVLCLMFICNLHIVCVCVCASGETAALFISVSVCIHSFMCSYNKKKKR